ncbi:hypothetical protein LCGC14_1592580 [marine sediment metagenome]|uniref:Fibronectin type-III domain-containing protein n=1 Tax=marine sediment metagenome TaxID=412755 RepID=A0A0F9LE09_9ZZZZ
MILTSVVFIQYIGFMMAPLNGGGGTPPEEYNSLPSTPVLDSIQPNPNINDVIYLHWSNSLRVWYYNVWRHKSGESWEIIKIAIIDDDTFTDTETKSNGLYYYRIEAVNNIGEVYSNIKSVTIDNPEFPGSVKEAHLETIIPSVSLSGEISLVWVIESGIIHTTYVERRVEGGSWFNIKTFNQVIGGGSYIDILNDFGTYEYRIRSVFWEGYDKNYYSNEQSVEVAEDDPDPVDLLDPVYPTPTPTPVYPTNPSIIINNGAETTDSFDLTLTLYCDDADEMQFRIDINTYLNWTTYSTTYILTITKGNLISNIYRIGVIFRNENGTTEDAGYDKIFDDILYEEPTQEKDDEPPLPFDYTMIYILIVVLGVLIGAGILLRNRKKRRSKNKASYNKNKPIRSIKRNF